MNQVLELYLQAFVDYAQSDQFSLLLMAELAINNRNSLSTGVSPFFLSHSYHMDLLEVMDSLRTREGHTPIQQAESIIRKLQEATDWAQLAMAVAQQRQEDSANKTRQEGPSYKVGDKVWLSLENICTDRPSNKLDACYAKFTVTEVIGSHSYRLDTPPGIRNVFHSNLLRPTATHPLTYQVTDNSQPSPQIITGEDEFGVETILQERQKHRGRGRILEYLVKWDGYARPTWEPASALQDTAVLDIYEARKNN